MSRSTDDTFDFQIKRSNQGVVILSLTVALMPRLLAFSIMGKVELMSLRELLLMWHTCMCPGGRGIGKQFLDQVIAGVVEMTGQCRRIQLPQYLATTEGHLPL